MSGIEAEPSEEDRLTATGYALLFERLLDEPLLDLDLFLAGQPNAERSD